MRWLALLLALLLPWVAQAQIPGTAPITITPPPGVPASGGTFTGHVQLNALDVIAKQAYAARLNNPRVNPVMASPPAVSVSSSHNGALTNITTITTAASSTVAGNSAFNYYGGAPTSDGAGGFKFPSTTVSGVLSAYVWRLEVVADSAKFEYKFNCISATISVMNWTVNGQYISQSVFVCGNTGIQYVTVDFTNVGGRATRNVILEAQNTDFLQMALGPTETLSKPLGTVQRVAIVGDSITASGGMLWNFMGYAQILPDMLGIRDVWNLGVGGTGIIATGGQLACPARVSDLVAASPNIIILACGRNDTGSSAAAVTAALLAWLQNIRAQAVLVKVPIIVFATWGNTALATEQATETAMQSAVTTFNDPLTYFIPMANAAAGPAFYGTGCQGATTGAGNSDIYIYTDCVHPSGQNYGPVPESGSGHWFFANWLANAIMQQVLIP